MLGLYIHIPFCSAICNYCNFNRGLYDDALKTRYVDALRAEILRESQGAAADTIFFGGGTPSLLTGDALAEILERLRQTFVVDPDAEITVESNPESLDAEKLARYRHAGVNRISLGVQTLEDDILHIVILDLLIEGAIRNLQNILTTST